MEHMALKKTLVVRRHEGHSLGMILPLTETQKTWRTEADHVKEFYTFLTKRRERGE